MLTVLINLPHLLLVQVSTNLILIRESRLTLSSASLIWDAGRDRWYGESGTGDAGEKLLKEVGGGAIHGRDAVYMLHPHEVVVRVRLGRDARRCSPREMRSVAVMTWHRLFDVVAHKQTSDCLLKVGQPRRDVERRVM